jgi:beta-lactamase superfamily II metal-dependent hydrolase
LRSQSDLILLSLHCRFLILIYSPIQLLPVVYCVSVYKVAHHGSGTSTTSQFLAAVDPEVTVISVGADNPFGHSGSEAVERLIDRLGEDNVYRTDDDNTIELITDRERFWMKAYS